MPNATDVFAIAAVDEHEPADIDVESMSSYVTGAPGQNVTICFTYNPGRLPAATELGFGVYDTQTARNSARTTIEGGDGTDATTWNFGTQAAAGAPSLTMTPSAGGLTRTLGDHKGQLDGAIPSGASGGDTWYGLVAIRQGDAV
ncbi:MAG: hypothetical protein OXU23_17310 [Candidatus Poribacteria bacterium]|nr:hypothetical protein [Candidatus Poribacteria bacterium]